MAKPKIPDDLWTRLQNAQEAGAFDGEGYTSTTDALRGIVKDKLEEVGA